MAVVYRHRRLDTNEIFYVGIGKSKSRAYKKSNRTKHWKRVVNKAGYLVEILKENLSWGDACELEELLISEYGRKDLGEGNLINMTNGGDGVPNLVHSQESKDLISKNHARYWKGKKRERGSAGMPMREVLQFSIQGEFIKEHRSATCAAEELKINRTGIVINCKGRIKHSGGYVWKYKVNEENEL